MSVHAAKKVGLAFEAINRLQLGGLLSDAEAKRAMARLVKKAYKLGMFVSNHSVTGERLFRQIRIYWGSSRGTQCNRLYPSR